ncbi:MAG: HAD family hydrolase, partial [Proteobacteria bacterium]
MPISAKAPLGLEKLNKKTCRSLKGVFCDINDTLTLHGKLPAAAYKALWDLHHAG